MLHQASLQTSVDTENTRAAETGMVQKTGTEIRRGTGVKIVTERTATGLLPGITGVTNLAGIEMNVITGHPGTGRGHGRILETDRGRILEVKRRSRGQGHKNFCQDRLHQGLWMYLQHLCRPSVMHVCLNTLAITAAYHFVNRFIIAQTEAACCLRSQV